MKKYKYTVNLSKDWDHQINHNVVTHIIEKGTNNFCTKSIGEGRVMTIVSTKNIEEINVKKDIGHGLCYKIVDKVEFSETKFNKKVKISGFVSYSFVSTKDNKSYCPIDIKTNKILHKDKLDLFLTKNLGINVESFKIKGIPKLVLSDKITLYDRFYLEVIGEISDNEVFEKLQYNSIGKRKSYGLGYMEIEEV